MDLKLLLASFTSPLCPCNTALPSAGSLLLRPTTFLAGSLVDFLKTSEGIKLRINKLLDMAAQVRGDRAVGLVVGRVLSCWW